jgi:hypothetical protein
VLAVGAGVALLAVSGSSLLAGCRSAQSPSLPAPPPTPTPDEALRRRAVARVTALQDAVTRLGAPPALAQLPAALSAACATQLTALGEIPAVPSGTGTTSGSPTGSTGAATSTGIAAPTPTASTTTASTTTASTTTATPVPATPAGIVAAQLAAASQALRDCTSAGAPGLAVLLSRLAAGHAAGADLLAAAAHLSAPGAVVPAPAITAGGATTGPAAASPGGATPGGAASGSATAPAGTSAGAVAGASAGASSPPPSLGSEQAGALARLLQGQHAAIYAYGVVTAWVAPPLRERAHLFWSDHLAERDTLEQLLIASGASAPAASAAYDLGTPPAGSPAAVTLAANVEGRLATLAASAVGAGDQSRRLLAAELLIAAARRQSAWTSTVSALPGG